jgi:uncharacterized protein YndB with AHSA1/START domain
VAARPRHEAATEPAERVLVITRVFDAPPSRLFEVWTDPEHIARWWGPRGFTVPHHEIDVRAGGRYRICMRSPDGTDHWLRGVYREIVARRRLVFTYAWEDENSEPRHETLVTLTFAAEGDKTKLTLRQAVFESVTARDAHEGGWTSNFDRLAEYVARS